MRKTDRKASEGRKGGGRRKEEGKKQKTMNMQIRDMYVHDVDKNDF